METHSEFNKPPIDVQDECAVLPLYSDQKRIIRDFVGLTFRDLREANIHRVPVFKNKKGETCHQPDGSDWCLAQWCNAACGELGETANLIKKIERGDFTLQETREELGKEIADVITYLDILAFRAGIDLGEAVRRKFNEVSERIGCDIKL